MTHPSPDDVAARHDALPDEELLAAVRAGDTGAYAALYRRHLGAALAQARRLVGSHDGQDVAQEAFLKVLRAITRGGGPHDGFVGYLMRAVRNEAIDRLRRSRETAVENMEDVEVVEAVEPWASAGPEGGGEQLDRDLMHKAFNALPLQWQRVLWLTEVDGLAPREVAPQLRRSPNAVAQLSHRAREGLRTAWLQAHVDGAVMGQGCRQTAGELGAYERGQLSAARAERTRAHLEDCVRCSVALRDLQALSTRMRGVLLPLVLGSPVLLDELSEVLPLAEQRAVPVVVPEAAKAAAAAAKAGGSAARLAWWRATAAAAGVPVAAAGVAVLVGAAGLVLASQHPDFDSDALAPPQEMASSRAVDAATLDAPLEADVPDETVTPTLQPGVVEEDEAQTVEESAPDAGDAGDAADGTSASATSPGGGATSARPEPATTPAPDSAVEVPPTGVVPPAADVPPAGEAPPTVEIPPAVEVPPAPDNLPPIGGLPAPGGGSPAETVGEPSSKPGPPAVPDPPLLGGTPNQPPELPTPPPPPGPPLLGGGAPPWLPEDPTPPIEDPPPPPEDPAPPIEEPAPPIEEPTEESEPVGGDEVAGPDELPGQDELPEQDYAAGPDELPGQDDAAGDVDDGAPAATD